MLKDVYFLSISKIKGDVTMRKIWILVVAIVLCFVCLTSCSSDDTDDSNNTTNGDTNNSNTSTDINTGNVDAAKFDLQNVENLLCEIYCRKCKF